MLLMCSPFRPITKPTNGLGTSIYKRKKKTIKQQFIPKEMSQYLFEKKIITASTLGIKISL